MPRDFRRTRPRYVKPRGCGHRFYVSTCDTCKTALAEIRADRVANQERLRRGA